jgi:hypothetical protein
MLVKVEGQARLVKAALITARYWKRKAVDDVATMQQFK